MADGKKKGFSGFSELGEDINDILVENKAVEDEKEKSEKKNDQKKPESSKKNENSGSSPKKKEKNNEGSSPDILGKFVIFGVVVFIVWLIVQVANENNNSSKKDISKYSKSNDRVTNYKTPQKDNYYESKPSPSTSTLSTNELKYCVAEQIRLDAADSILDKYSKYEIGKYNNLVDDYNLRCKNKKYYENTMSKVKREINKRKYSIEQEGINRFPKVKNNITTRSSKNTTEVVPSVAFTSTKESKSSPSLFGLTVKATPSDARVRILNIKPKYHDGIRLKKGSYHIEVSRKGYNTIDQWVILDKEMTYTAELIKKYTRPKQYNNVPDNAWVSGANWYCNDGYRKRGNECVKLRVPDNAWVSGSNWYCNDGYRKKGNDCVKFRVPDNAWVSGSNWYCNDGYRKRGNECISIGVN